MNKKGKTLPLNGEGVKPFLKTDNFYLLINSFIINLNFFLL